MATGLEKFRDSTLLIVGHGRSGSPESTQLIQSHAAAIAARQIFKTVKSGFLKCAPAMAAELAETDSTTVYIVPCFASPGQLTKSVIPKKLGLTGHITQRGDQTIFFSEPIGTHPRIIERQQELLANTLGAAKCDGRDAEIVVIGHGSTDNPQSAIETQKVAAQLAGPVKASALFIDQTPNLADWREHCTAQNVFVLSHLFSGGSHETIDVPEYLGIDPTQTKNRLTDRQPIGPIETAGRTLWLCPPIGADDVIQEVIIARVNEQ